jgi:PAS domain S-box-containing protein
VVEDPYPVRWMGRQAVVTLPEQITESDSGRLREQLLGLVDRGPAVLIADMTATVSCHRGGAAALLDAYQHASGSGTRLRLAVTAEGVRRVLAAAGLDRLVSIYPSVRAAAAAGTPAGVIPLTPQPGQAARTSRRRAARLRDEALPEGATPAMLWRMVDALADGVVLVDAEGVLMLANRRAEELFGYTRGELTGQRVESLVPAGLRSAHESQRAGYAHEPSARPMGARARLSGLRKDGTTVPVRISLSPVQTATGRFTMAVVRDISEDQPPADLAELARAAAAAEDARKGRDLLDLVINGLFRVGLSLQSAAELPHEIALPRIADALQHVDDIIGEIRDYIFADPGHGGQPDSAPPNGSR